MDPELKAAVEGAYRVFARYGLGGRIDVDQGIDGVGPLEERLLVLTPLREIPAELLATYTDSPRAWNDGKVADDFRALLPRYFELIADGVFPTTRRKEETLCRLAEAQYRTKWPDDEVRSIDCFFVTRFKIIAEVGDADEIAFFLALVQAAGGEVASLASPVEASPVVSQKERSE